MLKALLSKLSTMDLSKLRVKMIIFAMVFILLYLLASLVFAQTELTEPLIEPTDELTKPIEPELLERTILDNYYKTDPTCDTYKLSKDLTYNDCLNILTSIYVSNF